MNTKGKTTQRKRGRPAGKHRVPLSLEERRARNAQYERERRDEQAQAVAELVQASGLDPTLSYENLLRHVCCYFRSESRRPTEESVESLRQYNGDLMVRIEQMEARLAVPTPPQSPTDEEDTCMRTRPFIYKRKERSSEITYQPINTEVVVIQTEVDMNDGSAQITEQPAYAPVQMKSDTDTVTLPSHVTTLHQDNAKKSRPHKKRKIDQNTAVAVEVKANPSDVDIKPTNQCKVENVKQELGPQKREQRPQETEPQADPFILGLFTEEQAKYDIVQYYINLLKEEGYDGGATTSSSDQNSGSEPSSENYAVFQTNYQG